MVPENKIVKVSPDTGIEAVMHIMRDQNIGQVPVVDNGELVGVIGRDRLLALLQTHIELKS